MSEPRTTVHDAIEGHLDEGTGDALADLARGRRSETPFLLVGATAIVVGAVAALLAGVLLLVWWLG